MGLQIFTADSAAERGICNNKAEGIQKKGMVNALERRKALTNEGAKSKRVKDEKTCQREAEGREERDRSSQVVSLS